MAQVFLGIGSNIERERYIAAGLDALQGLFQHLALSPVYDSPAIGFEGQPFLNLVAAVQTELPLLEMAAQLRHIEVAFGRPVNATRFSPRHLDIDILTYDDVVGSFGSVTLPRDEILQHAFVLRPLSELSPDSLHPVLKQSYQSLWAAFDRGEQSLRKVDFAWCGRAISSAD
jgi:2-amino-4-hydroxy-6-hydroxymethyldihydropteridine diphosphokinase